MDSRSFFDYYTIVQFYLAKASLDSTIYSVRQLYVHCFYYAMIDVYSLPMNHQ